MPVRNNQLKPQNEVKLGGSVIHMYMHASKNALIAYGKILKAVFVD